jgi:drug/metabolite transporter (DMT)-like permease
MKRTWQAARRSRRPQKENTMTLVIYLVGWIVLIGGVCWALIAMHVSQHTIEIVAVIMLGVAIITGATRTRNRDRS